RGGRDREVDGAHRGGVGRLRSRRGGARGGERRGPRAGVQVALRHDVAHALAHVRVARREGRRSSARRRGVRPAGRDRRGGGAAGSVRSTGLIAAAWVVFVPVAVVPVAVNVGVHAPASRSPCVTTWRTLLHTYESPGARAVERLHDDALSGPASATLARATLPVLVIRIHGATWSPSRPSAPPV